MTMETGYQAQNIAGQKKRHAHQPPLLQMEELLRKAVPENGLFA